MGEVSPVQGLIRVCNKIGIHEQSVVEFIIIIDYFVQVLFQSDLQVLKSP